MIGKISHLFRVANVAFCLALIFSQLMAGRTIAQGSVLRFERISLREGLSQSSVYAILQDHKGFIWFGTEGGLNKYDGYQFTIFKHDPDDPDTLSDSLIWTLYEDREGSLWVGTGKGLDRFDRKSSTFSHYRQSPGVTGSLSGSSVWAILEDSFGSLWVGTNDGGLNQLDRSTGEFTHYRSDPDDAHSLSGNSVKSLYEDRRGNLWIGTNAGLNRYDRASGTFVQSLPIPQNQPPLSSDLVLSIYEDSQGNLWVGTNGGGLYQLDPVKQEWRQYKNKPQDPYSLSSDVVWSILEDHHGRLWVGTDGGGLDHFDRQQERFYHHRHDPNNLESLSRNSVRSLYEDRSGVFWVGTYGGGLSKSNYNLVKFDLYRQQPGLVNSLSDNYIWSICEDRTGILWLGTFQGGLNKLDRVSGTITVYRHEPDNPESLSSNDVRAILEDSRGNIWLGTGDRGLNRFIPETQTFEHFRHDPKDANSLLSDQIRALFEDRSSVIWVGTYASGLDRYDLATNAFSHYRHEPANPNSLSSDRVRAIYQDQSGVLWIGSSGGIDLLDGRTGNFIAHYQHEPGDPASLSHSTVFGFYEGLDGTMWIATFGGGLNRFDRATQTFTHYTETDGLPHNQVYSILSDMAGNLWLSTNNGLSKFNPLTDTFRNFGVQDGLQSAEFNLGAAFKGRNGELFFGGIDGLNTFFPEKVRDNPNIPPVVITAFQKFNQTVKKDLELGESIELSYRDNFISFEFAALDYTDPKKNQYAYMLEGFDKDWVDAGERRYVSYTNLGGGEYVFRVRGSNNDGVWNETGISVPITIIPPFWQTLWFTLLCLSAGLGGAVGIYGLRVRNFKNQKDRLEVQVIQRTAEIERRRKVAESLRDILTVLNSNRPLGEILTYIAQQAMHLLACDSVAIYRLQEQLLTVQATQGLEEASLQGLSIPVGKGATGMAVLQRKSVMESDTRKTADDIDLLHLGADCGSEFAALGQQYRALLSTPLIVQDDVYGALTLYYHDRRDFSQEEIDLAVMVSDQAALALETARLRDQAGQIAVIAERNRLARDLHDAVTQTLFSSSLIAEVLPKIWERDPAEGRKRLDELRQLNRGALAEMRSLLLELRPAALLEADLHELFGHLVDAFVGRARLPVKLDLQAPCETVQELDPDVKVAFYRIAQEALNNITKHARATQVTIDLCCDDNRVSLRIFDDGQGFDRQTVTSEHLGLAIMAERAEDIGAVLEVQSDIGAGTLVLVTWMPALNAS